MDDDDAADVQVMSSSISDSKREDDVHEPYSSGVAFDSNYKINHPYQASVTAIGHRTVVGLEHVLDETDDYSLSRNGDGDKIPSVHQTEQSLDIEVNEPNSWDACSVSSEHETNRVLECRNTPDAGIMDLFPPELPILCNITQQMPGNNDVSIEMTFVDRDEHPWTSISIVKDHSKRFPNNSSGSKGDVSYESVIENIFTTDFSVQTALSQEECSSGVSCSEGPCKEVSSECPLPDQENMTVDKFLSDHTKNKLAHEKEASCDKPSDRKGNREHPLYFSNRKRSFSTGRNSHSRNNNLLKQCRRAISNSADRINEISHEQACFRINEISHEQACFETCIADIKMGDSVGRSCKGEVRNLLKQFTQPMDLLYPESKDFNCKNVIYDCFFMSVDDLSPSQSTNGGNQERGNESATSASPVVPHSSEDEEEAGSDVASALVTKEIKHRPIKQPTVPANVLDKQTEASDAWVFLDSEGKHQKRKPAALFRGSSSPTPQRSFIQKLMPMRSSKEIRHRIEEIVTVYKQLAFERDRMYHQERLRADILEAELAAIKVKAPPAQSVEGKETKVCSSTPTTSTAVLQTIKSQTHSLEAMCSNMQEFKIFLLESESNIKQTIVKYISDKQVEKHLLKAVKNYVHMHADGDIKFHCLAQELIQEQSQTLKNHRESAEASISSLQKRNQALEDENVHLLKKIEKMQLRQKLQPDDEGIPSTCKEGICVRNNDKLRNKLSIAQASLDNSLAKQHEMQTSLDECKDEVHRLKLELDNLKAIKARSDADHEIELAMLNKDMDTKGNLIRECAKEAELMIEELENLRKLFKETGYNVHINWDKLKVRNNSLHNLIHVCRYGTSELGRELIVSCKQLALAENKVNEHQGSSEQLKTCLRNLEKENGLLKKQFAQIVAANQENEKKIAEITKEKLHLQEQTAKFSQELDSEMRNVREVNEVIRMHQMEKAELEKLVHDLTAEKQALLEKVAEKDKLTGKEGSNLKKISGALDVYELHCNELIQMNKALHSKIDFLQNTIEAIQNYPEKLESLEKEYYRVVAEKNYLSEQVEKLSSEQAALYKEKDELHAHVSALKDENNKIKDENVTLGHQITEAETRSNALELDNYHILQQQANQQSQANNSDIKIKELENGIQEKNKQLKELISEAQKYAEIIQTLQNSCGDKEQHIVNLRSQCCELSSVCEDRRREIESLKRQVMQLEANLAAVQGCNKNNLDHLQVALNISEKKLKAAQRDIEVCNCQLAQKEQELAIQSERVACLQCACQEDVQLRQQLLKLQRVLKDKENESYERDKLIENQKELLSEIENLHRNLRRKQKKCDSLTNLCNRQTSQISELEGQLQILQANANESCNINSTVKNLQDELEEMTKRLNWYKEHCPLLEQELERYKEALKKANEESQLKISKLQNIIQNLQDVAKNLEKSMRSSDKELKASLSEEIKKRKSVECKLDIATRNQDAMMTEINGLKEHVKKANEECRRIEEEFCMCQEEMLKREAELIKTIQDKNEELKTKVKQLLDVTAEKEQQAKDVASMRKAIIVIEERNKELESRVVAHGKTLHELTQVKRKSDSLETQVHFLQVENDKMRTVGAMLERHSSEMILALTNAQKELQEKNDALNKLEKRDQEKMETMKVNHWSEREQLLREIKEMESGKMHFEQSTLELSKVKELLEKEQQDLSEKLLKAVRLVLTEKIKHQKAESRAEELTNFIAQLESDKIAKEDHVMILTNEIQDLKQQLYNLNIDNQEAQEQVKKLEDSDSQMQQHSCTLQTLINELHKKLLVTQQKNQKEMDKMKDLILVKEATIMENKKQISLFEDKFQRLTKTLNETQEKLLSQREEQSKLEKEIINLQAEKRDLNLRLHGVEGRLQEELALKQHLQETSKRLLDEVSKLRLSNLVSKEDLITYTASSFTKDTATTTARNP